MDLNINMGYIKKYRKRIILMLCLTIIANVLLVSFIAIFYYKKVENKDKEMQQAIAELQNQANGVSTSNNNNVTTTIKTDEYEKLSIDNDLVISLHDNLKECEGFVFKTGGFDSKNIPNDLKIQMSFFKLLRENKYSNQVRNAEDGYGEYQIEAKVFKNSDMQLVCKDIFGDSIYNKNEVQTYFLNTEHKDIRVLKYDSSTDSYIGDIIQGGGGYKAAKDFVVEARKYKDKIEIYAKEYYYDVAMDKPLNVYADYDYTSTNYYGDNLKNLLKSYDENTFNEDLVKTELLDKLHTVKYTYTLNNDGTGKYYFSGFERIN